MAYLCVLNNKDGKYILPEFSGTVFKSGQSKIDSKASHMFINVHECFYKSFQEYRKGE